MQEGRRVSLIHSVTRHTMMPGMPGTPDQKVWHMAYLVFIKKMEEKQGERVSAAAV